MKSDGDCLLQYLQLFRHPRLASEAERPEANLVHLENKIKLREGQNKVENENCHIFLAI